MNYKINLKYVKSNKIIEDTIRYQKTEHLIEKKLNIAKFDDGIILPYKNNYGDKNLPNGGSGGVLTSDKKFVQESYYDGDWLKQGAKYEFDEKKIIKSNVDVIYIGNIGHHFGHFLIDQVTRLWFDANSKNFETAYIAYIGSKKLSDNFLEFINLLGISEERLIWVTKPTQFSHIYIPEQSAKAGTWYTKEFKNIFNKIAKNAMNNNKTTFENKKIYFTRTQFNDANKKEIGENIYEKIFKDNGYTILSPEKLSLSEMIQCINTSDEIVCVNGTIPLNIIFALKPVNLVVLNKTEIFHKNLMYFTDIVKNNITYIDIYSEKHKGKNIGIGPFLMEYTDSMKKYCNDLGLHVFKNIKKYELKNRLIYIFLCIRRNIFNILHSAKKVIKKLIH